MKEIVAKELCVGCTSCANICPKKAISMEEDSKGFKYPIINQEECIDCGMCKKVCPILNYKREVEFEGVVYAAYNKNENIRSHSSSGGIANLLAEYIIEQDGIVIGASFDRDFNVIHSIAKNKDDIKKFMGSKYVQSNLDDVFKQIKTYLDDDKYVLFTGTPCQVEGLKSFLIKDYNKLYTQDSICHGVPSPKVWIKYLQYRKLKDVNNKEEITDINFRNKDKGWSKYDFEIKYETTNFKINHSQDLYFKAFLKNTDLRESCYNCLFKKKHRISDITLADYWGITNIHQGFEDDKGVSAVIINTNKGKELFEKIKRNICYEKTSLDDVIKYNPSMINSSCKDLKREKFFRNLDRMNFYNLIKKYTYHPSLVKRIIRKIRK